MWLKRHDKPAVRPTTASRRHCYGDFARVMRVVVYKNNVAAFDIELTHNLKASTNAGKIGKPSCDGIVCHAELLGNGDRRQGI